jgi:acetyltransferase
MIHIERLTAKQISAAHDQLVNLLVNVVDNGASVNFVAPMDHILAENYWTKVAKDAESGERIVLVAYDESIIVGSVQLVLAMQPNGQHRAEVQKLLVHSQHRRKGIGVQLMKVLEDTARDCGRRLLILDTEQGSVAESLYEKVGYQRAGVIPEFALSANGQLITTVIFYRFV